MNSIIEPGLVLYLPLSGLEGSALISRDARGHLGAVTGAAWCLGGRSFDNTDDRITVNPVVPCIKTNTAGTILAWIYKQDTAVNEVLNIQDNDGAQYSALAFRINDDDKVRCLHYNNRNPMITWDVKTVATLVSNVWYMVGITQDGVSPQLYVNGEAAAQNFVISTDKTKWLAGITGLDVATIGAWIGSGVAATNFFNGKIGAVYYFSRALTPAEVKHIYLATKWRYR